MSRKIYAENPERGRDYARKWRAANLDLSRKLIRDSYKKRRAENPDGIRAASRRWHAANPDKSQAISNKRRARRLNAVPSWYGELDRFVMHEAAALCVLRRAATGFAWQVDHMVPLQAVEACGLHVAANFQVIPARLNMSKQNRMVLTQPGEWLRNI